MFISYNGTIYNLALASEICSQHNKVYLCQGEAPTIEIDCGTVEEAERVINNIQAATNCMFINNK